MPDVVQRIRRIIAEQFFGNQAAAARAIGASPPAISRILKGDLRPGSLILRGFSELPDVNGHWLITGEGEPFMVSQTDWLPVFEYLLSCHPLGSLRSAHGVNRSVTAEKHSDTRYWYHITPGSFFSSKMKQPYTWSYHLIETSPMEIKKRCTPGALVCVKVSEGLVVYAEIKERSGSASFLIVPPLGTAAQHKDSLTVEMIKNLPKELHWLRNGMPDFNGLSGRDSKKKVASLFSDEASNKLPIDDIVGIVISKEEELE